MTAAALALAAGAVAAAPGKAATERLRALDGARRRAGLLVFRADPSAPMLRLAPLVVGVVVMVVAGVGPGAAVAIVGGAVVELWRRGSGRGELDRRQGHWAALLDDVVARLRTGASVAGAFGDAGTGTEVGRDVASAVAVTGLGGDPAAALEATGDPVAAEVAAAWRAVERHGIPAADVLDRVRADLADRRDRGRRVEASLAGPRATGVVLGVLPPVGVLLGTGLGADPLGVFASGPLGAALAVVGSGLLAGGLLWTDSLVAGARP